MCVAASNEFIDCLQIYEMLNYWYELLDWVLSPISVINITIVSEIMWFGCWIITGRVKCSTREDTSHSLWWYSWTGIHTIFYARLCFLWIWICFCIWQGSILCFFFFRCLSTKSADSVNLCFVSGRYCFSLQFYDLKELFKTGGEVPDTNYIFMVNIVLKTWIFIHEQCICSIHFVSPIIQTCYI